MCHTLSPRDYHLYLGITSTKSIIKLKGGDNTHRCENPAYFFVQFKKDGVVLTISTGEEYLYVRLDDGASFFLFITDKQ